VEDDVSRLVTEAERVLGAIDVLINNAGIARKDRFLDITPEQWDRVLQVNLRGMFLVAQAVARHMVAQGGGVIVNMASTNALGGEEELAHYNASKGGVLQLTRTMAVELGRHGVRVNCLCPGFIRTPLNDAISDEAFVQAYERDKIPLGRAGTPEEVAAAYAFLASDDASFIHGEALVIDGGQLAVM
jgi:NAD(P)-dependent dehydrogenase (short-subunit alcohol dehydrogenase family)